MKLRTLSLALALAGVAAISSAAYADDSHSSGFFTGVGAGYNHMTLPSGSISFVDDGVTNTVTASSKKYMFDIYGGYLFDMGSGFDLGPMLNFSYYAPYKLSDTTGATENVHIYNFNFEAAGQYTWQSFFARVNAGEGYFSVKGSASGTDTNNQSDNDHVWKPLAGFTLGYYFTPAINAGLYYQHVFGSSLSDDNPMPKMDSVGISVEYSFGTVGGTAS
jgi:hypothetical protein